jgi:hypothetical protein
VSIACRMAADGRKYMKEACTATLGDRRA